MKIVFARGTGWRRDEVFTALRDALFASRFSASMTEEGNRTIKISNVRLRQSKPYCGNHPNACEIGGVDKKARFLEGADWVEFNDLLNDVLDKMGVDANVSSVSCVIRKGTMRRIHYGSHRLFNQMQWVKDGDPEDYQGYVGCEFPAPASTFPEGTPGIHTRIAYNCVG